MSEIILEEEISETPDIQRDSYMDQCWKFLSPGHPRRSGLGLGNLFPEVGSPGGWPEIAISQLLWGLRTSMTTQFAVQRTFEPITNMIFWVFPSITSEDCHFVSIRATNHYSGLPGFRVRSPAGLPPDYNEFATLTSIHPHKKIGWSNIVEK